MRFSTGFLVKLSEKLLHIKPRSFRNSSPVVLEQFPRGKLKYKLGSNEEISKIPNLKEIALKNIDAFKSLECSKKEKIHGNFPAKLKIFKNIEITLERILLFHRKCNILDMSSLLSNKCQRRKKNSNELFFQEEIKMLIDNKNDENKDKILKRHPENIDREKIEDRKIKIQNKKLKIKNKKIKTVRRKRKRRTKNWFSKIPHSPNMKGSVIFVNGNSQQYFDDPCKILSVNFVNSNENFNERLLTTQDSNEENGENNAVIGDNKTIRSEEMKEKITKLESRSYRGNNNELHCDTIIRRRKISKLDKSIKTTTVVLLRPKNKPTKNKKRIYKKNIKDSTTFTENLNDFIYKNQEKENNNSDPSNLKQLEFSETKSESNIIIQKIKENENNKRKKKRVNDIVIDGRPVIEKVITRTLKNSTACTTSLFEENIRKIMKNTNKTLLLTSRNGDQTRLKSTWKSECECESKPCPRKENRNTPYKFPIDWDYDAAADVDIARKMSTLDCPTEDEKRGCPITNEDLKKGTPCRKPLSAAALNRCNLEKCKKCRKLVSKCGNPGKNTCE